MLIIKSLLFAIRSIYLINIECHVGGVHKRSPAAMAARRTAANTASSAEKRSDRKLLLRRLRSMPRVSAEAESVSAMRMTRSAMGTVKISR